MRYLYNNIFTFLHGILLKNCISSCMIMKSLFLDIDVNYRIENRRIMITQQTGYVYLTVLEVMRIYTCFSCSENSLYI